MLRKGKQRRSERGKGEERKGEEKWGYLKEIEVGGRGIRMAEARLGWSAVWVDFGESEGKAGRECGRERLRLMWRFRRLGHATGWRKGEEDVTEEEAFGKRG